VSELPENKLTPKETGELNKQKILDAYTEYVQEHSKAPTIQYLVDTVGVTKPVIYKHLRSLQLNEMSVKFKPRSLAILEGICKKAEDGDVAAAKLMLQLVHGWNEKKVIEQTNTNRSLKVVFTNPTQEELKKIVNNEQEQTEYTIENEPDTD